MKKSSAFFVVFIVVVALVFRDLNRYGIGLIVTCGAKKHIRWLSFLIPAISFLHISITFIFCFNLHSSRHTFHSITHCCVTCSWWTANWSCAPYSDESSSAWDPRLESVKSSRPVDVSLNSTQFNHFKVLSKDLQNVKTSLHNFEFCVVSSF